MHSYLNSPSPRMGAFVPALSVAPRINGAAAVAVRKLRRVVSITMLLFGGHRSMALFERIHYPCEKKLTQFLVHNGTALWPILGLIEQRRTDLWGAGRDDPARTPQLYELPTAGRTPYLACASGGARS